jgi:hypothetical protein
VPSLSQIRDRVRTRFEHDSTTRWSDADINAAINAGLEELAEATGYYERSVSLGLKEDRTYYDLRALIPDSALNVVAVWHENTNRWLNATTHREMTYAEWEKVVGDPIAWFPRGMWWLGLWPHPSSDVDQWVRVYYCGLPPELTDDTQEPVDLPDDFHTALEDYALYELQHREGETKKALDWWQSYRQREHALGRHVRSRVVRARTSRIGGRG